MQRMLARIAALALCTSALSACSILGGDDKIVAPQSANNSPLAIAADLTSAINQAQTLRMNGDLDGATRVISQLMLAAPDDARVVGEYGKLLVQQDRSDDAVQFLHRAVELDASNWTYYSALGVAYDQLKDSANAKNAYEHALALKPGEPAVLNNYAMSRMLAGDTSTARALLLRAKASGSTDPKLDQNLALLDSMSEPAKPAQVVANATPAPSRTETPAAKVAVRAPVPVAAHDIPPVAHASEAPVTSHLTSTSTTAALRPAPLRTTAPAAITPAGVHAASSANSPAQPVANSAPTHITRDGVNILMQAVPIDPKAGKVLSKTPAPAKTATAAHTKTPATTSTAASTVKPATNKIPALRMTADATQP